MPQCIAVSRRFLPKFSDRRFFPLYVLRIMCYNEYSILSLEVESHGFYEEPVRA